MTHSPPERGSSLLASILSVIAIALAIAALLRPDPSGQNMVRGYDPIAPVLSDTTKATDDPHVTGVAEAENRRDRVVAPNQVEGAQRTELPAQVGVDAAATAAKIEELAIRIGNLEAQQKAVTEQRRKLSDIDSIPAALAVLLASRGVMTKVGDVEAIQKNLGVLAALSADPARSDWDRIEAYRGMIMFGTTPEQQRVVTNATPAVASIMLTSSDPDARSRAAGMISNFADLSVAGTLQNAYGREREAAVRSTIIGTMLRLADDPGIRETLRSALKRETDGDLLARIRRTLARH